MKGKKHNSIKMKKNNKKDKYYYDENEYVPDEYKFKSYMAYVLWGPFAEDNKKLPLLLLGKSIV